MLETRGLGLGNTWAPPDPRQPSPQPFVLLLDLAGAECRLFSPTGDMTAVSANHLRCSDFKATLTARVPEGLHYSLVCYSQPCSQPRALSGVHCGGPNRQLSAASLVTARWLRSGRWGEAPAMPGWWKLLPGPGCEHTPPVKARQQPAAMPRQACYMDPRSLLGGLDLFWPSSF